MFYEILTERIKESTLKISGNKPSGLREKDISKKGARIFDNDKIYNSSFVGEIEDDQLFKDAKNNKAGALDYNYELPSIESRKESCLSDDSRMDRKFVDKYLEALETLRSNYPNFIFSGSSNYLRTSRSLRNSNGVFHQVEVDIFSWHFLFKDKSSANIIDGYMGNGSIGNYSIDSDIDHLRKMLNVHSNIVDIDNKKYPVIFLDQGQILGKLTESFRIDNYNEGIGVYRNQLGKKIVNEKLSLVDSIYNPEKEAVNLFDGDGLTRREPELVLIENGTFSNLVSDLRNAKKYNGIATGNGVRSYKSAVSLGFNKLIIKDGLMTPEKLLKRLDRCIIVSMAAGGEFTDEGSFATPVQLAYLMEKGEYVGRLPQVTLKSSLQNMLGNELLDVTKGSLSGLDSNPSILMSMSVINN